ncbi:MAG: hypothetical protein WBD73_14380 [Candidatus Acidiferrales bacterium]
MLRSLIGPKQTQIFFWVLCKCFEKMAGTTGLEPATSAVTEQRLLVLQQLTRPRGLPKDLQVVQDIAICGLGCGLENPASRTLPSPGSGHYTTMLYQAGGPRQCSVVKIDMLVAQYYDITQLSSHRGKPPQYWDHAEEEGWAVVAPDQSH